MKVRGKSRRILPFKHHNLVAMMRIFSFFLLVLWASCVWVSCNVTGRDLLCGRSSAESKIQSVSVLPGSRWESDRFAPVAEVRSSSASHPHSRQERFPSAEERVQIYMSNWYSPPCHESEKHAFTTSGDEVRVQNMTVLPLIQPDKLFYLKEEIVLQCARSTQGPRMYKLKDNVRSSFESYIDQKFRFNMNMYCQDVVEVFEIIRPLPSKMMPVFMQFGDMKRSHDFGFVEIPHFKKFRSATDNLESIISPTCVSPRRRILPSAQADDIMQPIVWKLASHRHYSQLPSVSKYDTPWPLKKDMAIFRGQLTGALESFDKKKSAQDNCDNMVRCQLVQQHSNSSLVDAKLTTTRKRLPEVLGGVKLVSPKVSIKFQMEYKGLIMLEGNDVASGLKWALLSQSVVLMPKPKHTSWAMEERLEPWVHYVPLNDKATDVEEKVQWIIENDEKAQRISKRASLWIEDMMFHPNAARDERLIKEEMIRRYQAHFVST